MLSSKYRKFPGYSFFHTPSLNDSLSSIQQSSVLKQKVDDIMLRYRSTSKYTRSPIKPHTRKHFFKENVHDSKKSKTTETLMQTDKSELKVSKEVTQENEFIDFLKAVDLSSLEVNSHNNSPKKRYKQLNKNLKYLYDLFKECNEDVLKVKDMNKSLMISSESIDIREYRKVLEDELASSSNNSYRKSVSDLEGTLNSQKNMFTEDEVTHNEKNESDTINFINGIYNKLFI